MIFYTVCKAFQGLIEFVVTFTCQKDKTYDKKEPVHLQIFVQFSRLASKTSPK